MTTISGLLEIPPDVVLEIFSFIDFTDLINLTRSCKQLRSLLLDMSCSGIEPLWRLLHSADPALPRLPKGYSEPWLAAFVLDRFCMECDQTVRIPRFMYLRRLCRACFIRDSCDRQYCDPLLTLIPPDDLTDHDIDQSLSHFLKPGSFESTGLNWEDILPVLPIYEISYPIDSCQPVHSIHDGQSLIDEINAQPFPSRSEWAAKHLEDRAVKENFVADCQTWLKMFQNKLIAARREDIVQRVNTLGWKKETDFMKPGQFERLEGVSEMTCLTDEIWEDHVRPRVLTFLHQVRVERLITESRRGIIHRSTLLSASRREYIRTQPPGTVVADLIDLALMPPFTHLFVFSDSDAPPDSLDWKSPWLNYAFHGAMWREAIDTRLLSLDASLKTSNDLTLATKTFGCDSCGVRGYRYPNILIHNCPSVPDVSNQSLEKPPIHKQVEIALHQTPSSSRKFSIAHCDVSQRLLEITDLDPARATYDIVRQVNPLYECHSCKNSTGRRFFNYPAMVVHYKAHLDNDESPLVTHTRYDERLRLGILEERYPSTLRPASICTYNAFRCVHCPNLLTQGGLVHHMQAHGLELSTLDVDYMFNMDCQQIIWPPWSSRVLSQTEENL